MAAIQIDGEDATLIFIEDEDTLNISSVDGFLVNYTAAVNTEEGTLNISTADGFLANYSVFVVDPVVDGVLSIESWE